MNISPYLAKEQTFFAPLVERCLASEAALNKRRFV